MDEKRSFIRYSLSLSAELDSSPAGQSKNSCCITDISRKGCRIENIPLFLLENRQFMVKAYIPFNEKTVDLKATVQWSARTEKCACAGCTIEEIAQGDKFQLIDLAYKKWRSGIPRHANRNGT